MPGMDGFELLKKIKVCVFFLFAFLPSPEFVFRQSVNVSSSCELRWQPGRAYENALYRPQKFTAVMKFPWVFQLYSFIPL